jgi:alanyl-tRNA synthetase
MQLIVDPIQRYAKMRAHTATHLLHAELAKIFPNTKQAGSLVDEDYLRFDFYTERMLSDEEIQTVEIQVNTIIRNAYRVNIEEMPKSEAELLGAKMFFEDKYGDKVRVVSVAWEDNSSEFISVELCGGTHVENTKDIGAFVIIWQQAVASGIKRIMAYTGPRVLDQYQNKNKQLSLVANTLECDMAQIQEKLEKVVSDYLTLQLALTSINQNLLLSAKYEERTSE